MSEKDQAANGGSAPNEAREPEIIEATVIEETPEPGPEAGRAPEREPRKPHAAPTRTGMSLGAKAGWSLAALLAAFAGGVYFAPQFAPGLKMLGIGIEPPQVDAGKAVDLTPLSTEMANLKAAFDRQQEILAQHEAALKAAGAARDRMAADLATYASLGQDMGQNPMDPTALADLQARVNTLSADLSRLSELTGADDPRVTQLTGALALARAEVTQLKARLNTVEESLKAVRAGALEASPRGRLVLALGRLKDRAMVGQPFGEGLAALRPDFASLPAIDQQMIGADIAYLEEHGTGITPYETLVAGFDAMASATLKAADKAEGGFLANLFSSRRTDAGATGLDAVLLKAERSLMARDVAGAVKVLEEGIEGPATAASEDWRAEATTYAGVTRAFDRLTTRVSTSQLPLPANEGASTPDAGAGR